MQHFFIESSSLQNNFIVITDGEVLHQIKNVMRMKLGDRFVALDNSGFEYLCELQSVTDKEVHAKIIEKRANKSEPEIHLTLFQALPKKMELFEWVLQKGTEIGVFQFCPIVTARTERNNFPKRQRLEKILKEAAEQCERGKIPSLSEPITFSEALKTDAGVPILLHHKGKSTPLSTLLPQIHAKKSCAIFVGPEGGFTDEETEKAQKSGILLAKLGPRILRTETAGLVAASLSLINN